MSARVAVRALARDVQTLSTSGHALLPCRVLRALSVSTLRRDRTPIASSSRPFERSLSIRTYATEATATKSKPGRPRNVGRPKLPASEKKTAAKPGPPKRKAAAKKPAAAKKKPAAKKKKPAAKQRPAKKPLTAAQQTFVKVRRLRQLALLDTPKQLPHTEYTIFLVDNLAKGSNVTTQMKEIATKFKSISTSDREHLANVAEQNKLANAKALATWIEKHTPDEIRHANNARRLLNKLSKAELPEGRKRPMVKGGIRQIRDVRAVKRAQTPYIAFVRDRWASGDFKDTHPTAVAKLLSQEWKTIDAAEKQRYQDAFKINSEQYIKDYNAIFTKGVKSPPRTPVVAEV